MPPLNKYFDYNSTTPVSELVAKSMINAIYDFANPSSNNTLAQNNRAIIHAARDNVAALLCCAADRIYFTSGGSEANNWGIKGLLHKYLRSPGHIITTEIEHASVLETVAYCKNEYGFTVSYIKPGQDGAVRVEDVAKALTKNTQLVSIMYANNETGVIQPVEEIGKLTRKMGIHFHVDGVQVVGKMPLEISRLYVDCLSFSAHKFYGPKGVGGLVVNRPDLIVPLIHGGGQEGGLRGGTENTMAIAGLSMAAHEAYEYIQEWSEKQQRLKQYLVDRLKSDIGGVLFNGTLEKGATVPNTVNISISGVRGEALAAVLDKKFGYMISVGSACSNNKQKRLSHVLSSMGLSEERIQSAVRISIGRYTTKEQIELFVNALVKSVTILRNISGSNR